MSMTKTRIGSKGQIVIPKEIRDRVPLHTGDAVNVELHGDSIIVTAVKHPTRLAGRFARSGMATRLLEERAAESR
jgi:AbrB family looped-hinge helix DNA binding protein